MRHALAMTGIWLCIAAMVTCLLAAIRAWRQRIPMHGEVSVKYLSPWSLFFLAGGFAVGTVYSPGVKTRIISAAAALLQFLCGYKLSARIRQADQQLRGIATPPIL